MSAPKKDEDLSVEELTAGLTEDLHEPITQIGGAELAGAQLAVNDRDHMLAGAEPPPEEK